ncbi:TIGR03545 family protein [Reinekea blandensis]|uniref:TIGR03545 family protein n=1 Tax=Reinekea blandensis MED297 TaxID=314283 RepID=A4BBN9_9GAMM|nr:TIGR03545 family protein [Reinekea blandensis]EAR10374.1 hypothetical protein MED297_01095 [Reinekea sp. MED297] [Reinekea blandensis MED297]
MKLFRWSGLIGFVLFTAVLMIIGLLFLDGWTKKAVEAAGFQVNGAEVTVADVDLTLSPLGFRFEQVAVADADDPMRNAVEIGQMRLAINFAQLFLGNVRLEDVTVADVQTRTEREAPARLAESAENDSDSAGAEPSVAEQQVERIAGELPSPTEVVNQQTQNTREAVSDAQQVIADARSEISAAASEVPDEDELAAYRQRIAEIKARELNSIEAIRATQQQLSEVASEAAQDKLAIESLKREIESAAEQTRSAVAQVGQAPAEDWAQLREDYPLNQESAMKVARLLIGDKLFDTYDQASYWYEKAKPWIRRLAPAREEVEPAAQRLDGTFVRFPHPDPTARFQLDQALVSFRADDWPWEMTIEDLSSHRGELYIPTKLALQRGTDDRIGLRINGLLDRIDGTSVDTWDMLGQGVAFAQRSVALADVNLTWTPEPANITGNLVITDGELDGQVQLAFPQSNFDVTGDGLTTRYLRQALSAIDAFTIDIDLAGRVTRPQLSVRSNLDNQLGDALADVAKAEYDAWLADARQELDARVAELRAPVDDAAAQVRQQRDEVIVRINQFESEVEAEIRSLESKIESERKRLEQAAADRLKAEREKAEAAARKEAEEKLKEEAEKLKDQFSF